ncbi:MAG: tRNA (adenosine(37)-N6)-threonylcarbamoyltransferase complex dimerization subunit type 1 TsaB [Myxococcaceae bacterium]|nr:MAG: tRNA (adenosine(37)-N6)-threonylcarbamoyltransferase complex dimerization subunit type 1 TsaB [Myxococcaceae bacterium]
MRPVGRGSLLGLMRLLALDTSTATASVAVVDDGCVLSEINRRIATGHATHLLGLIEQALTLSGLRLDELDALAIGRGPGSFTGLRAGFATIRGLELATGLPLWGVGSLQAIASGVITPGSRTLACIDGRRDELFAEGFGEHEWLPLLHLPPEEIGERALAAAGHHLVVVYGDLAPHAVTRLTSVGIDRFVVRPRALGSPTGRTVALEVLAGRATLDDGSMEPTYVRPPDAKLPKVAQDLGR